MVHSSQGVRKWWKEAVVYQIYPASFLDTNGDGLGDINGVTSRLDYLKELGVDVLWLSPIYESPQADMGYDIADYMRIYAPYGDMHDVERLIHDLHQRNMKLIMDLVVNHTSDQHPWFLESRSSVSSPKRDWYIWKKPARFDADGTPHPPNNWGQILGEANSAWIFDEDSQEYYLAIFTRHQPDLNWENPEVRSEVRKILRFWLDKGVSGFRMDVINLISKEQTFPDGDPIIPNQKYQPGTAYFANGPRLHEFLLELKTEVLQTYTLEVMTVGEMPFVSDEKEILSIVHHEDGFLNMIFNFDHVEIDAKRGDIPGDFRMSVSPWMVTDLKRAVSRWQRLMIDNGGWNSVYCENHDQPRSVSHFCDDSDGFRELGSKLLCLMETTLCGTLFIYQGEELGMRNVPESWGIEEYKDVESINFWNKVNEMYPGDAEMISKAKRVLRAKARDNSRTPMQWDNTANAGFCREGVKPWMRVNEDFQNINASHQLTNHQSVYRFWQRLLNVRKIRADVFVYGDFNLMDVDHDSVFSYIRTSIAGEIWLVALNFTAQGVTSNLLRQQSIRVRWEAGNYFSQEEEVEPETVDGAIILRPWEGLIGCIEMQ